MYEALTTESETCSLETDFHRQMELITIYAKDWNLRSSNSKQNILEPIKPSTIYQPLMVAHLEVNVLLARMAAKSRGW